MLNIQKDISKSADPARAKLLQQYFKTGKGEYGEGDIFVGLTVPQCRNISLNYIEMSLKETSLLLKSKIHEERLCALLVLVDKYALAKKNKDEKMMKDIFDFYLSHTKYINNWDLVDLSSHEIIGSYLFNKDRSILYKLAKSNHLWEKRIAIVSTAFFIKNHEFEETIKISEILMNDTHDLIHKATGWMLREMGKRDIKPLLSFLDKYYHKMPRTMLRYAIEKLPEKQRKSYLVRNV